MPEYKFENPETGEQKLVFFHMDDEKRFIDEKGLEWKRIWINPFTSIDTEIDPHNPKDFIKVTNKPDSLGSMLDRSAELHEKRKDSEGRDPVREQFYADYSKKHGGKKHYIQQREENQAKLKEAGIKVSYGDDYS